LFDKTNLTSAVEIGKLFMTCLDSLLNKIVSAKRNLNRVFPLRFVHFPADIDSFSAIFVVWFEHKVIAIATYQITKIDLFTVELSFALDDSTRPWDMRPDQRNLFSGKVIC